MSKANEATLPPEVVEALKASQAAAQQAAEAAQAALKRAEAAEKRAAEAEARLGTAPAPTTQAPAVLVAARAYDTPATEIVNRTAQTLVVSGQPSTTVQPGQTYTVPAGANPATIRDLRELFQDPTG